jgi:amidohydrolase
MPLTDDVREAAEARLPELVAMRRAIHSAPEIGFDCERTVETVLQAIRSLPLEILWSSGSEGIAAVLRGRGSGASVLLRADMDALPIQEPDGLEFASTIPDRMHACGHDLHTATLVGAAQLLSARRDSLAGDVVFMFQPAEELLKGSVRMIDNGILAAGGTRVAAAYALHVLPSGVPCGAFTTRPGTCMSASATVRVTLHGRGTHASTPYLGSDPIAAACHLVIAYQTAITRSFSLFDPALLTVGAIHAGTAANVIPAAATMDMTVRAPSQEAFARVIAMVEDVSRNIAAAMGVAMDMAVESEVCALVNDPDEVALVGEVVSDLFGEERMIVMPAPRLSAEDFAFILRQVPGAFVFLGAHSGDGDYTTAPGNHSPDARYAESVMADGAAYMATIAMRRLAAAARPDG